MIEVLWEYEVSPECSAEFERHYSATGAWAQFFARDMAYRGTVLLRDHEKPHRYVTRDVWESLDAYRSFRERFVAEYERIDQMCGALTLSEQQIGIFEVS
jgi:heme-degrading monooxygenase HmoA